MLLLLLSILDRMFALRKLAFALMSAGIIHHMNIIVISLFGKRRPLVLIGVKHLFLSFWLFFDFFLRLINLRNGRLFLRLDFFLDLMVSFEVLQFHFLGSHLLLTLVDVTSASLFQSLRIAQGIHRVVTG